MDEGRNMDKRFLQPLHSLFSALEMREVPLMAFDDQDPLPFLEQVAELLHIRIIYASSVDAKDQLLDLLGSAGYIFLIIDAELTDPLYDAISYYLHMRDIAPGWEPELERRYQEFPIDRDNYLVLVTELDILNDLSPDRRRRVQELATPILVQ